MPQILAGNKKGPACRQAGGLTVEILVVAAIIALALVGLSSLVSFSLDALHVSGQNIQAGALAQEEMEALRSFRDGAVWANGLGSAAVGTDYYLQKTADNPPQWQLVQGQETVSNFTRKIIFFEVQRDVIGNIVESYGVVDPETKKASVTVAWSDKNGPHQISLDTYFTNWNK